MTRFPRVLHLALFENCPFEKGVRQELTFQSHRALTLLAFMSSSWEVRHSSSFFFSNFFKCCTSRKASSLSRLIRSAFCALCFALASREASCDCCCIWKNTISSAAWYHAQGKRVKQVCFLLFFSHQQGTNLLLVGSLKFSHQKP